MGLFGIIEKSEIKNFTINNAIVKGRYRVGVVVSEPLDCEISGINLTGLIQVDGVCFVGGMFGTQVYANLTNLTIDVEPDSYVNANSGNYRANVGGVVGLMAEGDWTVSNVKSNINVIGTTTDVGGIAGLAQYGNTFVNCTSSGNVTLKNAVVGYELAIGGIAGNWNGKDGTKVTFTSCSYTGQLSSQNREGNIVTEFENNGLVGIPKDGTSPTAELIIN